MASIRDQYNGTRFTDEVATTKFDIEAYLPMKIGAKNDNVSLAKGWIFQSRIPSSIRFCNTLLRE